MSRWPSDPRTDTRLPVIRLDTVAPTIQEPRNGDRRNGHRRERDERSPRRSFKDRLDAALVDVSVHRAVAYQDLAEVQFDGHPYAARRGIDRLVKAGLVEEHQAKGPEGEKFRVLTATHLGSRVGRTLAAERGYDPEQETWSGFGRRKDLSHDVAIYRKVHAARVQLEAQGMHIRRIRLDAEMRRAVVRASETARAQYGRVAADEARWRAAAELHLPIGDDGKVAYPDARIEAVTEDGRSGGRVDIDVASDHYGQRAIQAKAAAGFVVGAANARAARNIARAGIGPLGGSGGSGSGGGADRDPASVEL